MGFVNSVDNKELEVDVKIKVPKYRRGRPDNVSGTRLIGHQTLNVHVEYEIYLNERTKQQFAHVHKVEGWPFNDTAMDRLIILRSALKKEIGLPLFYVSTAVRAAYKPPPSILLKQEPVPRKKGFFEPPPSSPSIPSAKITLFSCPRCSGAMVAERDYGGAYKSCLQCGNVIEESGR